jgi:putative (di)nucleoside polyphosphate hydrolase
VIDKAGYRYGVGIILVNDNRQVFFAKRIGMLAWQFPQGGMMENETPEQTMFRELKEEIGLNPEDVQILASTRRWLRYRLPTRLVRHYSKPLCIGQKRTMILSLIPGRGCLFGIPCDKWSRSSGVFTCWHSRNLQRLYYQNDFGRQMYPNVGQRQC